MRLLLYLAVLPYLVAANSIRCPDYSTCPVGKTCCDKPSGGYKCCDIEEDMEKMFPGTATGMNMTQSKRFDYNNGCMYCTGTCCPSGCCEYRGATCCSDRENCCPRGNQCCRRSFSIKSEWCCPTLGRCGSTFGYCYGGAGALIPAISSIGALIFLLALRGNSFV